LLYVELQIVETELVVHIGRKGGTTNYVPKNNLARGGRRSRERIGKQGEYCKAVGDAANDK
jgi:hypothetical protein